MKCFADMTCCCAEDVHLKRSCIRHYLDESVFPVLLPALDVMMTEALKHRCTQREKIAFNGCDFLTEWLYNKNPHRKEHVPLDFHHIPFVQDWLIVQ
ncbi:IQ domain-containing protein K-like [Triplophysa rosa]|uniref:IQ domain-containing protein K-like n=1 Tax=Triplophysa rosa TaxID=992332 RepID=UPI002545CED2|nr:IQ domain-containing protein K-like [Triplophysa rosa]